MAGGFGSKDPKNNKFNKSGQNSEILKFPSEYSSAQSVDKTPKFSLKGILNIGQTLELNKNSKPETSGKKEFLGPNFLQKEENSLIQQQQEEIKKSIEALKIEIQKLIDSAENLENEVEIAALQPIIEANEYQVSVLKRLKNLIVNFTQNISEAGIWFDSFKRKKQKHNAFWGNVKNKKNGGEQYLFSGEHSASRSAN